MLKDYCIPKNDSGSEEEFVGDFWDERWAQAVDDLAARRAQMVRHPYYPLLKRRSRGVPVAACSTCGCGMGEWTVQLAEEGVDVVGIDIAARRIELLRNALVRRGFAAAVFSKPVFRQRASTSFSTGGAGAEHFEAGLQLAFQRSVAGAEAGRLFSCLHAGAQFPRTCCAAFARRRRKTARRTGASISTGSPRPRCTRNLAAAGFAVDRILFLDAHEGSARWLAEWLPAGRLRNGLATVACGLLPAWMFGHMIFGIAHKPEAAART
ncbi:MAG: class I SAM-dependent methyltransferase [Chthoniobacter sp.]